MVLNLAAIVFLFTCGIVFGNGQSTIGENELFDFKQKMATMEEKMAKQEFRISSLEDQLKFQDIEIKDLRNKVLKFGPKVQEVEKSVMSLRKIIMRIKPDNKLILPEDDTKEKSFHIRTEGNDLGIHGENLLHAIHRRETTQPIAFYAYMSSNEDHPSKHHILVFDNVKTNVGNAYSKFTGIFTAPINGVYVITCTITMDGKEAYASYDIMKNADIEGTFFVDAEYSYDIYSSSLTVVLSLEVGDALFLRISSTYTPHGSVVSNMNARSSVAGWLIQ